MDEYIHPELNKKVEFFGGSYSFVGEGRLNHQGKEVFYLLGMAGDRVFLLRNGRLRLHQSSGVCSFLEEGVERIWAVNFRC